MIMGTLLFVIGYCICAILTYLCFYIVSVKEFKNTRKKGDNFDQWYYDDGVYGNDSRFYHNIVAAAIWAVTLPVFLILKLISLVCEFIRKHYKI